MLRLLFTLSITLTFALATHAQQVGDIVINEFVAKNDSVGGYQEPDGGFGDWIELFNRSSNDIDLTGWNLSDDLDELDKWTFPQGTEIAAGGYLIVWADDDEDQTGIHASFRLSGGGEELALSRGGTIFDETTFGEQEDNIAEARIPNGTGPFQKQPGTPLRSNETVGTRAPRAIALRAYPSPATDVLTVVLPEQALTFYTLFDASGRRVRVGQVDAGAQTIELDVAELTTGRYTVRFDGGVAIASFTKE